MPEPSLVTECLWRGWLGEELLTFLLLRIPAGQCRSWTARAVDHVFQDEFPEATPVLLLGWNVRSDDSVDLVTLPRKVAVFDTQHDVHRAEVRELAILQSR